MVQLNAHDEFKIFTAFLIYRLESKQAQWCLLGTALRNQVQMMREIKAASPQKLMLSSLLHLPLSCPHPRGSLVPFPSQHGPVQLCSSQDPTKAKGLISHHSLSP